MTLNFSKRVQYERLENGTDVYLLTTPTHDVVICKIALPGGAYATYEKLSVAFLLDDLIPGSTKKKKRSAILEQFELLGAHMSVHTANTTCIVTISSRSVVFLEAFKLAIEVLIAPLFPETEWQEAHSRLENSFTHALENTRIQANIALLHSLYQKGHPHWVPSTTQFLKELRTTTRKEVSDFYTDTLSSVGAMVCVVGDIQPKKLMESLREVLQTLPSGAPKRLPKVHVNKVVLHSETDCVRTLKDKQSIDTLFAIPLSLTREDQSYEALRLGVSILGASSSSRLFSKLRTEKNLTYGSYATLNGLSDGYPGYLFGLAVFPSEVFLQGRKELKATVQDFIEKGVTKKELDERKEEIAGKFKVGLSTTRGVSATLFNTLLDGKTPSYIDAYVEKIEAVTHGEVNKTISEQLDFTLLKTAAAGAVNAEGNPV